MRKVHDETPEDNPETAGNAVRDDVPTLDAIAREGCAEHADDSHGRKRSTSTPARSAVWSWPTSGPRPAACSSRTA